MYSKIIERKDISKCQEILSEILMNSLPLVGNFNVSFAKGMKYYNENIWYCNRGVIKNSHMNAFGIDKKSKISEINIAIEGTSKRSGFFC